MTGFPSGSPTVLGLPRSHWHCQLGNFHWEAVRPKALHATVVGFLADLDQEPSAPHLILTGDPGVGKSHLGVALYRQGALRWGPGLVAYVNVPEFCAGVKALYSQSHLRDPWEEYEEARRLVVLDDLFGRELSTHETGQILSRLIDIAYQNNAAVVLTMNPPVEEMAHILRPHEVSRILADATIVPMSAPRDGRRMKW